MSPDYKLLSTARKPFHLECKGMTTIYIYDVAPDIYNFLLELDSFEHEGASHGDREYSPEVYEYGTLRKAVFEDLGICEEGCVAPGSPYHEYELSLVGGCLILAETTAYNT